MTVSLAAVRCRRVSLVPDPAEVLCAAGVSQQRLQRLLPVSVTRMCSTLPLLPVEEPARPLCPFLVQLSCNWYVSLVPSFQLQVVVRLCDISWILMARPVLHVKLVVWHWAWRGPCVIREVPNTLAPFAYLAASQRKLDATTEVS